MVTVRPDFRDLSGKPIGQAFRAVLKTPPYGITSVVAPQEDEINPKPEIRLAFNLDTVLDPSRFRFVSAGGQETAAKVRYATEEDYFEEFRYGFAKLKVSDPATELGIEITPGIKLRTNFPETVCWLPSVHTDASGQATVKFAGPDAITRYRLVAVACAGGSQFGSAESAITIQKPLLIMPSMAHFARSGDKLVARGDKK